MLRLSQRGQHVPVSALQIAPTCYDSSMTHRNVKHDVKSLTACLVGGRKHGPQCVMNQPIPNANENKKELFWALGFLMLRMLQALWVENISHLQKSAGDVTVVNWWRSLCWTVCQTEATKIKTNMFIYSFQCNMSVKPTTVSVWNQKHWWSARTRRCVDPGPTLVPQQPKTIVWWCLCTNPIWSPSDCSVS